MQSLAYIAQIRRHTTFLAMFPVLDVLQYPCLLVSLPILSRCPLEHEIRRAPELSIPAHGITTSFGGL